MVHQLFIKAQYRCVGSMNDVDGIVYPVLNGKLEFVGQLSDIEYQIIDWIMSFPTYSYHRGGTLKSEASIILRTVFYWNSERMQSKEMVFAEIANKITYDICTDGP